jgi:hypothetical protein
VLIGARTLCQLDGSGLTGAKIGRPEIYWLMILSSIAALVPFAAKLIGSKFGLIGPERSRKAHAKKISR